MITVYTSPGCGYCHMAKEYFKGKKVAFDEKDISTDRQAMDWVFQHVHQLATPVIDIDGTIILGFDRERIDQALRAQH